MKIGTILSLTIAAAGLLTLAVPSNAQSRGHGGGSSHQGMNHGNTNGSTLHRGDGDHDRDDGRFRRNHVDFFFVNSFGFPFFGYPYWGYPYGYGYAPYGYYGYGYPAGAYYSYDPRGVYTGQVVRGSGRVSIAAQVQQQLAQAGYYHGAIDGIVGDGTRRAIRSYERANGLRVDGRIDNQLLATMGLG